VLSLSQAFPGALNGHVLLQAIGLPALAFLGFLVSEALQQQKTPAAAMQRMLSLPHYLLLMCYNAATIRSKQVSCCPLFYKIINPSA
jgi:hypothetical protein